MGTEQVSISRRRAGQHAQSMADRITGRLLLFLVASLLVLVIAFVAFHGRGVILAAIELPVIAAMVVSERRAGTRIGRWSRGAEGERKVGEILEDLESAGWRVLHDVSLGRGNIDHVLVGPGGAFTVETKSNRGSLRLDKLDPRMLKQAYAEKKLLEKISGLDVEALLVFSEAWLIGSLPAKRRGVTILSARMLAGYLERRAPVMPQEQAAEVGERLRLALEEDARSMAL
jgi:hypothetical protein